MHRRPLRNPNIARTLVDPAVRLTAIEAVSVAPLPVWRTFRVGAIAATIGLAIAGCSDKDMAEAPGALPPIVTTTTTTTTATTTAATASEVYQVRQGDTFSGIAAEHSVLVQALMDANPEIASPNDIEAGQLLEVPPHDDKRLSRSTAARHTINTK